MMKGSLSIVSACTGPPVMSRTPRVVDGFGASKTSRNGLEALRRIR